MQNFIFFGFFHPIVISEICSFSGKNSGKNFLKSGAKNFVLENSHKNKQIFQERFYPGSLQFKTKTTRNKNIEQKWFVSSRNIIKHFIKNYDDIDVNMQNIYGYVALHFAVQNLWKDIVKLLLKNDDINVNIQNIYGRTALHNASLYDHKEIVKLLLKNDDIDVNIQDNRNRAALYLASSSNNKEIVELLLQKKDIDVNIQNIGGYTALDIASSNGHVEIVKILENHIANN